MPRYLHYTKNGEATIAAAVLLILCAAVAATLEAVPVAAGFTLIEMSIVLVIIGLIIGGVLVGRDLIAAAGVRAQISQIEKYQAAVNTFRSKYGYLPGDIPDPIATQYGFASRGTERGQGDGNGILEANSGPLCGPQTGWSFGCFKNWPGQGELGMFWVDLSKAGLIAGGFNSANPTSFGASVTGAGIDAYFPQAALKQGNYIYIETGNVDLNGAQADTVTSYYDISTITMRVGAADGDIEWPGFGLSVIQAYSIDKKIDDGMPLTGRVMAQVEGQWVDSYVFNSQAGSGAGTALQATSTSCYDNGNNAAAQVTYSNSQPSGALNCFLSIKFQ